MNYFHSFRFKKSLFKIFFLNFSKKIQEKNPEKSLMKKLVKKKRKLFSDIWFMIISKFCLMSPSLFLPFPSSSPPILLLKNQKLRGSKGKKPIISKGILTFFLFEIFPKSLRFFGNLKDFSNFLKPTNLYLNAIHIKPFSTSVFKRSHLNICYYHQDLY